MNSERSIPKCRKKTIFVSKISLWVHFRRCLFIMLVSLLLLSLFSSPTPLLSLPSLLSLSLPPLPPSHWKALTSSSLRGRCPLTAPWEEVSSLGPLPPSFRQMLQSYAMYPESGKECLGFIRKLRDLLTSSFPQGRPPLTAEETQTVVKSWNALFQKQIKNVEKRKDLARRGGWCGEPFLVSYLRRNQETGAGKILQLSVFSSLEVLLSLFLRLPSSYPDTDFFEALEGRGQQRGDFLAEFQGLQVKKPKPGLFSCMGGSRQNLERKRIEVFEKSLKNVVKILKIGVEDTFFPYLVKKMFSYNFGENEDFEKTRNKFVFQAEDGFLEVLGRLRNFFNFFGSSKYSREFFLPGHRWNEGPSLELFGSIFDFLRKRFQKFEEGEQSFAFSARPCDVTSLNEVGNGRVVIIAAACRIEFDRVWSELRHLNDKVILLASGISKMWSQIHGYDLSWMTKLRSFLKCFLATTGRVMGERATLQSKVLKFKERLSLFSVSLLSSLFPLRGDEEEEELSNLLELPPALLLPSIGQWVSKVLPLAEQEGREMLRKEGRLLEELRLSGHEGMTEVDEGLKEGADETWSVYVD